MTEVPEHLLRRAKERRAALAGGEGAADAPSAAPEGSGAATPAPAAAAPATVEAAAAVPAVPEPSPPSETYLRGEAARRSRVPMWVAPVLLVLPFWAVLYAGAFGNREEHKVVDPLVLGAEIYRSKGCSGCHGAQGEGGVGPALADGNAAKTFPDEADHIAWVKSGSIGTPAEPKPYGDPNREGGQRLSKGGMPSFAGQLSEAEVAAVVQYEREKL